MMTEDHTEDWNSSLESTPVKPKRTAGQKRISDADDDDADDSNGGLEVGSPFDPAKEVTTIMNSIANSKRNKRRANNAVLTTANNTPLKNATVAAKSENAAANVRSKKDDSKKKSKLSATKPDVVSSSSSSAAAAAAAAAASASWASSAPIAATAKPSKVSAASTSSTTSARSTGGGYKKKLIRLFSTNAGDPIQAAELDAKVQFEHEKAALLAEHKAHADSLDRQVFELQLALTEAKQELALAHEERDAWKARCLNQKQKIEQLEADALKFSKMMAVHQYVPGGAFHNVREPSFCPDY